MQIHDILRVAGEEEIRTLNIPNAVIIWSGPYSFNEVKNKSGGGLYVTVTKNRRPLYVGQTGSYKARFSSRLHVLRIAACDLSSRSVYIGRIVKPTARSVNKKLRLDLESVLIRSYLIRARPVALVNKSSIRQFMMGPESAAITNKGTLPPEMKRRIVVKGNTLFELDLLGGMQEMYDNEFEEFEEFEEFDEFDGFGDFELFDNEDAEMRRRRRPQRRKVPRPKIRPSRPKPLSVRPKPPRRNRRPRRRPNIFLRKRRLLRPSEPFIHSPVGTEHVRWVQSSLNQILGSRLRINGVMNRATREALRDFQKREGLSVDGIAGPETEKILIKAKIGKSSQLDKRSGEYELFDNLEFELETKTNRKSREYVRWIQRSLNKVMGTSLKVDGISGRNTRRVIRSFQKRFSLTIDGIVGPQTENMFLLLGFSVPPANKIPSVPASGDWVMPVSVRVAGEGQHVRYDNSPAWIGRPGNCSGNFTAGANQLRNFIKSRYPGVSNIGGYNCRANSANTSKTSVHGVGRALDIMIPTVSGRANSAVGDPIANWLVQNAVAIGVQYIIWNRTKWSGSKSGRKHGRYGGPSPHINHLHVELNRDGATRRTAWFQSSSNELEDLATLDLSLAGII